MDQQHSDHIKRLNVLKHENAVKQKQIEEYQTRYDQMVKDAEEAIKTDAGESETAVVSICLFINSFSVSSFSNNFNFKEITFIRKPIKQS